MLMHKVRKRRVHESFKLPLSLMQMSLLVLVQRKGKGPYDVMNDKMTKEAVIETKVERRHDRGSARALAGYHWQKINQLGPSRHAQSVSHSTETAREVGVQATAFITFSSPATRRFLVYIHERVCARGPALFGQWARPLGRRDPNVCASALLLHNDLRPVSERSANIAALRGARLPLLDRGG